jgi:hypothetical protein
MIKARGGNSKAQIAQLCTRHGPGRFAAVAEHIGSRSRWDLGA